MQCVNELAIKVASYDQSTLASQAKLDEQINDISERVEFFRSEAKDWVIEQGRQNDTVMQMTIAESYRELEETHKRFETSFRDEIEKCTAAVTLATSTLEEEQRRRSEVENHLHHLDKDLREQLKSNDTRAGDRDSEDIDGTGAYGNAGCNCSGHGETDETIAGKVFPAGPRRERGYSHCDLKWNREKCASNTGRPPQTMEVSGKRAR